MTENKDEAIENFFKKFEGLKQKDHMELVNKYIKDEEIELFVDHIERFYGVEDEDELGMLAQVMITGFICSKESEV